MNFIKLTSAITVMRGRVTPTAYIRIDAIEAIYSDGESTTIGLASHNNGGYQCKESAEDVLRMIERPIVLRELK